MVEVSIRENGNREEEIRRRELSSSRLGANSSGSVKITITVETGESGQSRHRELANLGSDVTAKVPVINRDYSDRTGYDEDFLDITLPLPSVDEDLVARQADGEFVVPYEHFSVVMHAERKLALFTASNVDGRPEKRRPEDGDYSREGLGQTGGSSETWITDPRISLDNQLTDGFYKNDRGAFDKGHIVRREDVCWGDSYAQVQKANGDTFHLLNCSAQVAGFNQAQRHGIWGELENLILKQVKEKAEKYSIFAGPVLNSTDKVFEGWSPNGSIDVQIPEEFWKIVIFNNGEKLQAYGFLLKQSLRYVQWEVAAKFEPSVEWNPFLISIEDLEKKLEGVIFSDALKGADASESEVARVALETSSLRRFS